MIKKYSRLPSAYSKWVRRASVLIKTMSSSSHNPSLTVVLFRNMEKHMQL